MGLRSNLPHRISVGLASAAILAGALLVPALATANATDDPSAQPRKDDTNVDTTWKAPKGASTGWVAVAAGVAPAQDNLEFVAFSTGCRMLDTRAAGGAFAAGESRDLGVLDSALPATLGPCGVPARAKAVQLSLGTLSGSPKSAGYARVGPGGVAPTATVLQFQAAQGTSTTTTVPLSGDAKLRIWSAVATGFVADLLGYWQAPAWARVSPQGTLLAGSGVTSITKSATYLGDYYVYFDRPIAPTCAAVVTPESSSVRTFVFVSNSYVFVDAREYATTAEADGAFGLVVAC